MSDPKNRGDQGKTQRKGPVSQNNLLAVLKPLIDAARSKSSSRTRDDSRAMVRRLMTEAEWNTPFILRNLGAKRCRYLSSLGYIIESQYLAARPGDIERMNAYEDGRRG